MTDALFEPDGTGRFRPTDLARGPWDPDALHGGPVAALAARAAEQVDSPGPVRLVRLTLELLRPVPLDTLTVEAVAARPGRRVQLVDVTVSAGTVAVAWARGLRIRLGEDVGSTSAGEPPPAPEQARVAPGLHDAYRAFHNAGAELRFVGGRFDRLGPARVWVRLAAPVVPGEEPSPFQRVAAAADFGNGVSSVLSFEHHVFINPDLTVHVERPPVGEWVCLDAVTDLGPGGTGLASSRIWDRIGPVGRAVQSLLVERRSGDDPPRRVEPPRP